MTPQGKKVGSRDLPSDAVRVEGQRAVDAPGRRGRPRRHPCGHALHEDARRRLGRREEAVAPEGHRAARVRARSARRSGSAAASRTGRTRTRHEMRVNKKMRRGALRSALTDALQSGKLAVVNDITFEEPKTQRGCRPAATRSSSRARSSWCFPSRQETVEKSFRNLRHVRITYAGRPGHLRDLCEPIGSCSPTRRRLEGVALDGARRGRRGR